MDGPDDDTLLNRALLYLNQQGEYKENDVYTPALCHRLDTGTSGLVIIAKTPEAEELFLAAIKSREVKKTYTMRSETFMSSVMASRLGSSST